MKLRYKYILYSFLVFFALLISFYFWSSSGSYSDEQLYYIKKYDLKQQSEYLSTDTITIMTYNIGYLSGMTNNLPVERSYSLFENNLNRVINVIDQLKPDFIGFQEIDLYSARSFRVNQPDSIALKCGYGFADISINWDDHYVPFPYWPPSIHFGRLLSAQAILSRYPIISSERIVFDKPLNNAFWYNAFYPDRLAEIAMIEIRQEIKSDSGFSGQNSKLVIINVHLEAYDQQTRTKQAKELLNLYKKYCNDFPVLLIGDFNASPPYPELRNTQEEEPTINYFLQEPGLGSAILEKRFDIKDSSSFTFSSDQPYQKIDYIFYNKNRLRLLNAFVVHEAKTSSDHLPVMAEFVLINN